MGRHVTFPGTRAALNWEGLIGMVESPFTEVVVVEGLLRVVPNYGHTAEDQRDGFDLLLAAADEVAQREPYGQIRTVAREVIIRRYLREIVNNLKLSDEADLKDGSRPKAEAQRRAVALVTFYASSVYHSRLSGNDRKELLDFLAYCWESRRAMWMITLWPPTGQPIVRALAFAGHTEILGGQLVLSAIPHLFEWLGGEEGPLEWPAWQYQPEATERGKLAQPVELTVSAFAKDCRPLIQRDLQRIIARCSHCLAKAQEDSHRPREVAMTLLVLVARFQQLWEKEA